MPAAVPIISAVAAVVGTGASIYQGHQADKRQKQAAEQAKKQAAQANLQADMELNKANQKSPDSAAILNAARAAGQGGVGSTMLTGANGNQAGTPTLGKTTLLGG